MKDKVELDAVYPHSPERVWKALTDSDALSQWLMPTNFQPLIGYRFRLDRPDGSAVKGKVIEVEAGRLLAYTWNDDETGEESKVVWTLSPDGDGTRVQLEHLPIEAPVVNCLAIDNYFNWRFALRYALPGLLCLLEGQARLTGQLVVR